MVCHCPARIQKRVRAAGEEAGVEVSLPIAAYEWHYKRGAKAFRDGDEMPKRPKRTDDANGVFWLGYMMARAQKLHGQMRVQNILEPDPDDDPRPRFAA
jgi:hypothetical protein